MRPKESIRVGLCGMLRLIQVYTLRRVHTVALIIAKLRSLFHTWYEKPGYRGCCKSDSEQNRELIILVAIAGSCQMNTFNIHRVYDYMPFLHHGTSMRQERKPLVYCSNILYEKV